MEIASKKVSVILPIYNVADYLDKSLNSVATQSHRNLQIICVVDGATDNSAEICKNFEKNDSRFKVVIQENLGCPAARNNGMKLVEGDYICFVDPDDYIDRDYIKNLLEAAEKYNADIVCATLIRIKNGKKKFRTNFTGTHIYEDKSEIFAAANCPPEYGVINKMYKTSLIKGYNIVFERVSWCDDVRFCTETLWRAARIATVEGAKYYYVKRKGSIVSSQPSAIKQQERYAVRSAAVKFLLDRGVKIPKDEAFVTKRLFELAGIPLARIRVDVARLREMYLLFGIILVYEKRINCL